jgi:pimeloyl-ACP methyl ester carboxylesterase
MRDFTVERPRGGRLQAREDGDPRGVPVFGLHGTPGSRVTYSGHIEAARRHGIRLISYDRPGYGNSTAQPGRSVGDTAAEVAALADHLGVDRFGVWGHSGGGAPALACAALLGDRVVGVACLAGAAPYPAEGLDPMEGAGEANVEDFRLMMTDRASWEAKSAVEARQIANATPGAVRAFLGSLCSPVDARQLTDELVDFLMQQGREAMKNGWLGLRDDNLSSVHPWGFELASIRVPVQLWHGDQDRFVPVAHGRWLADRIPGVEAHIQPGEGHLTLFVDRVPIAERWLSERF